MLLVEQLAVIRGERLVFDYVSFGVPAGGALLLVGPNGSGKSTLLRVLAGLKRADAGRVLWDGTDVGRDPGTRAPGLAYVGHQDAVKPGLTVAENFFHPRKNVIAALAAMGLDALADMPARMLSAGQRRRLALARLLARPARLWLLDEPTLGLDAASVDRFGAMAAAHRAHGGIVVAATHLPLPLADAVELALV
ncbi:MAG: heme ABC exporter ATP-binding protein CcmA [Acetobacteraceae bacterium]|nr:heme ABC exporter ATP-binding protein CcmA [Acetobacteraceae bacterium]MSP30729.1 heme ABC exporter ATP-binding protein CcmA [Acetobacteraceae bacterium]